MTDELDAPTAPPPPLTSTTVVGGVYFITFVGTSDCAPSRSEALVRGLVSKEEEKSDDQQE